MKATTSLYLMLFVLILFPVLDISGHFINIVEFYIYISFFLNIKKYSPNKTVFVFIVYMGLFFVTVVLTAILAGKPVNNHDIFILRNGTQLIFLFYLLYSRLVEIKTLHSYLELQNVLKKCFVILSIPALIVYLQRADLLNARSIVNVLYKPQFFFLAGDLFSGFRYTSVFKDFFTAAVYFSTLCAAMFYFYLKSTMVFKQKIVFLFFILFNYVAQVFVARTSLVLIPFIFLIMTVYAAKASILTTVKRLSAAGVILVPIYFMGTSFLLNENLVKTEWILEGLNIFSSETAIPGKDSGSYNVMRKWNEDFFNSIIENPRVLFVPHHEYDLTEVNNPGQYSDGFYPQEVYRYGIYGMLAYFYLVFFLLKNFAKFNRGLVVIVILFAFLNYKGGNVFFMPKNIYLYAFVFAGLLILDGFELNAPKEEKLT